MSNFQYLVKTVSLTQPDQNKEISLTYKIYTNGGGWLSPPVDDLGKDGWELIYLESIGRDDFLAVFKKLVP